jgi:hypothetical protein
MIFSQKSFDLSDPRGVRRIGHEKDEYLRALQYSFMLLVLFFRLSLKVHFCLSITTIYLWLYSPCGPWSLFRFVNLYTVCRTPWTGISPSQGRYVHTGHDKHRINAHRHPLIE